MKKKKKLLKNHQLLSLLVQCVKKMLEMKNELEMQKKGHCTCSCIPTSFNISKNDKKKNIDKTKDSINLEADVHNIAIRFGRGVTPSDNGDNETQETIREMMKISV